MRIGSNRWLILAAGLLVASSSGCAPSRGAAEVGGTVTVNGKLQPGLVVTFYPMVEPGQTRLPYARGTSDEAGRFALTTEDGKPGATIGKSKVVVKWPSRSGHEVAAHPDPFVMPIEYTTVSATPLEVEVKEGSNDIPIAVEVKR